MDREIKTDLMTGSKQGTAVKLVVCDLPEYSLSAF